MLFVALFIRLYFLDPRACRHRKLSAEKARIRAYSVELDRRESELGEREAAVAASENALGTNSLERLAEREAEVAEREARAVQQEQDLLRRETEVMKANADVEARRTDLQQKWEAWFHDQQTRAQVLSRARVSEGEGASTPSRIPRSSEARAAGGILRAGPAAGIASSKSSQGLAAVQGRGAIVAARPVGVRRVSGGKVRVSSGGSLADVDMSVNIRERVAAGATGLGTSRSVRERELRMHERTARCVAADGDGASLEMRNQGSTSEGSDEWVDNESAPTSDEQDAQDGFADHQGRNWNAVPNTRFSGASAERERNSRRSSAIFSVARRQLGTSRTAADDSDVAMRTADEDSSDKENVSSSFGVQSPNEVDSDPFGGSFEKLGLRRSSSAKQPSQSVAAAPTSGVITMAGRPQAARPALQTRTTAPAASGPNIDLNGPVYDLSRDDDLPSPFLKKMERMPNSAIPRSGSNTNFMARAAALAAARGAQAQATRASDAAPEQEREKEKEKLGERAAIRASRRLSAGPSVTSNQLTAQTAPKEGQQGRIVRRPRSSALPSFSVAPLASTAPRISSTAGLSRILPERA